MAEPTIFEQYVLELVNRARSDPGGEAARLGIELNGDLEPGSITAAAKAPLAMNPLLVDAARGHGAWILSADTFSHEGEDGSSPGERMEAAGYAFTNTWSWGENIAMRTGTIVQETVELLHDQLFLSAGHRLNLLTEDFREAGLGLVEGDYDYGPPYGIWSSATLTQNFAYSGNGNFLLGVAFDDADGDRFYDPGEGLGGLTVSIRNMAAGGGKTLTSWGAGGWQTKLPAGSYEVTFSGPGLEAPVTRGITMGAENQKLDLDLDAAPASAVSLMGSSKAETMTGAEAADRLSAGGGNDRLFGGVGNDSLYGGSGADILIGGSGRDHLNGGEGDDRLIGGPGPDTLYGAGGADRFVFLSLGDRSDRIADFDAAAGDRVEVGALMPDGAGKGFAELAATGHARLTEGSSGAVLAIDTNGGGDRWLTLATFTGRSVADLREDFLVA